MTKEEVEREIRKERRLITVTVFLTLLLVIAVVASFRWAA